MSVLKSVQKGKKPRPRFLVLNGVPGVGKTTVATTFPSPLVLDLEDGSLDIDCARLPSAAFESLEDLTATLEELKHQGVENHGFRTIVIDSADEVETLILNEVQRLNNGISAVDIPYGKGYQQAAEIWADFIRLSRSLLAHRMMVILITHVDVIRFDDPAHESYSRYVPRIDKRALNIVIDQADEVLFQTYKTFTKQQQEAFGKEKHRALSDGERIWKCEERPAYLCKNRCGMPAELPATFAEYAKYAFPKEGK